MSLLGTLKAWGRRVAGPAREHDTQTAPNRWPESVPEVQRESE
jgi:hypothetical protein